MLVDSQPLTYSRPSVSSLSTIMSRAARVVADATTLDHAPSDSLALIDLQVATYTAQASLWVISAADTMLGALVDFRA